MERTTRVSKIVGAIYMYLSAVQLRNTSVKRC